MILAADLPRLQPPPPPADTIAVEPELFRGGQPPIYGAVGRRLHFAFAHPPGRRNSERILHFSSSLNVLLIRLSPATHLSLICA